MEKSGVFIGSGKSEPNRNPNQKQWCLNWAFFQFGQEPTKPMKINDNWFGCRFSIFYRQTHLPDPTIINYHENYYKAFNLRRKK